MHEMEELRECFAKLSGYLTRNDIRYRKLYDSMWQRQFTSALEATENEMANKMNKKNNNAASQCICFSD